MQMSAKKNNRLISGARVLCKCSLELPKLDPFSKFRDYRKGLMVMNVRGGCLYLADQLTDMNARKVFPPGNTSTIKKFTLYPPNDPEILIGDIKVRYLRLINGASASGLILQFVNSTEIQLGLLNSLLTLCPPVECAEDSAIPPNKLRVLR
jgi:hypothetical protein